MSESRETPTGKDLRDVATIAMGVAMFQSCAIVGALAERGAVDPLKVAVWAELFAANHGAGHLPEINNAMESALKDFARLLRSMATKPAGAGGRRQ